LEALGIDRSIILKYVFKKWMSGMKWIDLAQSRGHFLVNAVMNLRFA